jgi:transposase
MMSTSLLILAMVKKYIVTLTAEERAELEQFSTTGRRAADQITRARILLKADSNQPGGSWIDEEIASALDVSATTVERTRRRFIELGLQASLKRQPGGGRKGRCLNGEQEAHLVALVCSAAPVGRARWSVRLLAETMVQLSYVESVSHETVRQTLKKTSFSLGNKTAG